MDLPGHPTHPARAPSALVPIGVAVAGVLSITAWFVALHGASDQALALITRYTARWSFLLFVTVFATGAMARLVPSPPTRWMRRHRRYLGLSFALAHFAHLAALTSLLASRGEMPDPVTLVGGGLAYLLIAAMAATSNDASVRVLGARRWRALHLVGASYVWLIFMNSYVGRLLAEAPPEPRPVFAVLVSLGVAALALRVLAWWRQRARGGTAAAGGSPHTAA